MRIPLFAVSGLALALSGCAGLVHDSPVAAPTPLRTLMNATESRVAEVPICANTQYWVSAPSSAAMQIQQKMTALDSSAERQALAESLPPQVDFTGYSQGDQLISATAWADSNDERAVSILLNWGARLVDPGHAAQVAAWMRSTLEGDGSGTRTGSRGQLGVKRATDPHIYFVGVKLADAAPLVQTTPNRPSSETVERWREQLGLPDFERRDTDQEHSRWSANDATTLLEVHLRGGEVGVVYLRTRTGSPDRADLVMTEFAKLAEPSNPAAAHAWLTSALASGGLNHGRAFEGAMLTASATANDPARPGANTRALGIMFPDSPRVPDAGWDQLPVP